MSDPLAGLEDVPWDRLGHAYGSAGDTPDLLRRVADGRADAAVWQRLVSSLAHDGTVYEASARAVPFLLALTLSFEDDEDSDLALALGLLDAIAVGNAEDTATTTACRDALRAGRERLAHLAKHDDPDVHGPARAIVERLAAGA